MIKKGKGHRISKNAPNFLPEERIYCQRKKFVVLRRNFLTEEEISCQRKKNFDKRENFVSNATITSEFELKFPVSCVRCQKFPVGNTHTPTGKMTPWA